MNDYFSINLDKAETNSNWSKDPFKSQLNYAMQDVLLIEILKSKKELIKKKYNLVISI